MFYKHTYTYTYIDLYVHMYTHIYTHDTHTYAYIHISPHVDIEENVLLSRAPALSTAEVRESRTVGSKRQSI